MAMTNRDRVGTALDSLKVGLSPYIGRELNNHYRGQVVTIVQGILGRDAFADAKAFQTLDVQALLSVMRRTWSEVFFNTLGHSGRSLVGELTDVRNNWAHQETFNTDDTYRALDSASRLLSAVSSRESEEVDKLKDELLRLKFQEEARYQRRLDIQIGAEENLKSWRDIATPHKDVASGKYTQAEFAADLSQVHEGKGAPEYADPSEFFSGTYLTESLQRLLRGAMERLSGRGGSPVWQLQTTFGGGKTHSMLALYHLFSGIRTSDLQGIDDLLSQHPSSASLSVRRVVLVGTKISPGNPIIKDDGTRVNTLWGEMAWQLGGIDAFETIRADDENATNPGSRLLDLMNKYGPCLILIDEWVAYARMLHDTNDLPGGDFDTHFTFAQSLTESAAASDSCLLVVSLPASDSPSSRSDRPEDIEVGGERGRTALLRLRNIIDRIAEPWSPASAREGFEIVRRRLFEPLTTRDQQVSRDNVARSFGDMYRSQQSEFPSETADASYEENIINAYPIHPEVFERLYNDWSTLPTFQRTRGVLRLMASVIHSLWESGDKGPLIMPSSIPIDDPQVKSELLKYLSDDWTPIIDQDVDGSDSIPARLDNDVPSIGRISAARRVARTVYLGSAPLPDSANLGIEERRIKLGCVVPGESIPIFGDALRRLGQTATYLYQDSTRYWYSTQPTVTKLAADKALVIRDNADAIFQELDKRIRANVQDRGDFERVHPLPQSSQEVVDDTGASLVILDPNYPFVRGRDSKAEESAKSILENRGTTPRIYRNSPIFLAADQSRYSDLEEAICKYLAWDEILREKEQRNLSVNQISQSEAQKASASGEVEARIPETYCQLLVPVQAKPEDTVTLENIRLQGQGTLAARASRRLKNDDLLIADYGATLVRMDLDRIPLWRGEHSESVLVRQLVEDYGKYIYLSRLISPEVLANGIRIGVGMMTWESETFAYAEGYDEETGKYMGLQTLTQIQITPDSRGMLVKSDAARLQIDLENEEQLEPGVGSGEDDGDAQGGGSGSEVEVVEKQPRRYHGTAILNSQRVGLDASQLADEIISHLAALMGADVTITLEIEASVPDGFPNDIIRIVTENGNALKLENHGFEEE